MKVILKPKTVRKKGTSRVDKIKTKNFAIWKTISLKNRFDLYIEAKTINCRNINNMTKD